uniref:Myosin motor domain-containing protein n=2 Tax=Onchocerca ochengi TaxID=42157 RepID=A0A182EKC8_ONCOC
MFQYRLADNISTGNDRLFEDLQHFVHPTAPVLLTKN